MTSCCTGQNASILRDPDVLRNFPVPVLLEEKPPEKALQVLTEAPGLFSQVKGGEPLLQLFAVDWFESSRRMDNVAQSPSSCMQVHDQSQVASVDF